MKLLLIERRARDPAFIDAKKSDVDYVRFDYLVDTYATLLAKIKAKGVSFSDIALVQHQNLYNIRILRREAVSLSSDESPFASYQTLKGFLKSLKDEVGVQRFDFLACSVYDPVKMPAIFGYLESEAGLDLRASTNLTGNQPDGDWIMESDNVDIRDKYFTEAISAYKGTLYYDTDATSYQQNIVIKDVSGNIRTLYTDISGYPLAPTYDNSGQTLKWPASRVIGYGSDRYTGSQQDNDTYSMYKFTNDISNQLTDVVAIASAWNAVAALKSNGSVVTWGNSGDGSDPSQAIKNLISSGVKGIYSMSTGFVAHKTDGTAVCWGGATGHEINTKYHDMSNQLVNIRDVYPGYESVVFIKNDGSLLMMAAYPEEEVPSGMVSALSSGVVSVTIAGYGDAFAALKSDGSVYSWGYPYYGSTDYARVASQLMSGVLCVYPAESGFAALKTDGSVVNWSDWENDSSSVAAQLTSGVNKVISTYGASAVLKTDGTVICYGRTNALARYGDISNQLVNVKAINVSWIGTFFALKGDGSVIIWGYDWEGNSADISGKISSGVVAIFCGNFSTYLLKADGTLVMHVVNPSWDTTAYPYLIEKFNDISNQLVNVAQVFVTKSDKATIIKKDGSVFICGRDYTYVEADVTSALTENVQMVYNSSQGFAALKSNTAINVSDYYYPTGGSKRMTFDATLVAPTPNNVTIYIPMTYTLSGADVELFGQQYTMSGDKIIVKDTLNVSSFYEASGVNAGSWLKYRQGEAEDDFTAGPKDAAKASAIKTDIVTAVHINDGTSYNASYKGSNKLDASGIFAENGDWDYYHSLQDFVLSYFAKNILGHPGALAAISNDSAIRAKVTADFPPVLNEMEIMEQDKCKVIVQQIMNQDLARFNLDEKNVFQPVIFRAGDKVILQLALHDNTYSLKSPAGSPTTIIGGVTLAQSASASATATLVKDSIDYYLLEFTLA